MKLQRNLLNIIGSSSNASNLNRFRNIPFVCKYYHLEPSNDNCCFNHLVGLPVKDSMPRPIWQWQYNHIIKNLEEHKYNWILKATGIGLSEIALRWILYKCLVNDNWRNGIVCIVTGPNIDLAKRLIERAYNIIYTYFPNSKQTDYTLVVNNVEITAFPSNHLEAMHSLTNVRFILLDEGDYFRPSDQQDARTTSERYISKSATDILIASTPGAPGSLMDSIQNEEPCLYHKTYLDYNIALGTIFTGKEIAEQMKSPSFEQEYNLKYLSGIGNLFNIQEIDKCIDLYTLDDTINTSQSFSRWIGCDPGWGQESTFAIVVTQWMNGHLYIVHHEAHRNPLYKDMVHLLNKLIQKYSACKLFIDSSATNLAHELSHQYGEYQKYESLKPEILDKFRFTECRSPLIVPVPFNKEGDNMMRMLQSCISKNILGIHPTMEEVIVSLKSAKNRPISPYSLDKSTSAYHDTLDALRLSLCSLRGKSS